MRRKPLAERFRQIAPWRARTRNPKNRFDKKPVVTPGAAGVTNFTRQLRRNPLPLRIAQHQSNQG
jgi:late competence protein required for DNA uptake (superfamily II DNA/RNA helicase)